MGGSMKARQKPDLDDQSTAIDPRNSLADVRGIGLIDPNRENREPPQEKAEGDPVLEEKMSELPDDDPLKQKLQLQITLLSGEG